jgi:lysophospholipase L1-like esterase
MTYLSIVKLILSPILFVQGRRTKRTALRLPEPEGFRSGFVLHHGDEKALNLLFVGDSTMAGVGVAHQDAALASQTSATVSALLSRSVHWRLIAKSGAKTGQILALTEKEDAFEAHVLITATGGNDVLAQTSPRKFIAAYEGLVKALLPADGSGHSIISGLPPLHITPAVPQPLRWFFGKFASRLDMQLQQWIRSRMRVSYVSLQWAADRTKLAADRFHPGAGLYHEWSQRLARQIVHDLATV